MSSAMLDKIKLPIEEIKEKILSSFDSYSNIILKASPGSGKTTRVPQYLLEKTSQKIYILEPRRIAAKLAAFQVAKELGTTIGNLVGYVFRYEKQMCDQTKILFLTEGTFLKILSKNKNLESVGTIILDEFHERHLSTDAALSFLVRLQKTTRPDLKIIIMSATIETENLKTYLETAAKTTTIDLIAQRFPLKLDYLPNITSIIQAPLHKKIYSVISDVVSSKETGDFLVFLPGMREIRETQLILENLCKAHNIHCFILHGDLDSSEQEQVLAVSKNRKIILSTNIAESSVTIAGIRIVIDSGLQRESSYNFYSGLPELKITKISKASATQRAGRANREGAGLCIRLYAELDFEQRPYLQKPEIQKSDLSELYLVALDLFSTPLEKLDWFENPPTNALTNSKNLLLAINAINTEGTITEIGKNILTYPLHPRLGRVLAEAQKYSLKTFEETLSFLAEFLEEKNKDRFNKMFSKKDIEFNNLKLKSLEEIILSGFPDRVARTRGERFFDIITQNGETLKISSQISHEFDPKHSLWIVLDLNNKGEVLKCIPIIEEWLYNLEPFPLNDEGQYYWDDKKEQVLKIERTVLGKIVLSESRVQVNHSNDETKKIILEIATVFIKSLYQTQEYERLLTVNKLLNQIDLSFFENQILNDFFKDQLSFKHEDREILTQYFFTSLKNIIDVDNIFELESDFPMSIQLTDRRKIPIIYDRTQDPFIESFIQDFYGLSKSPVLAKGKISLTLKLLGPHKLALQVTKDLASFWKNTYPQMIKELSREYPRHHWPLVPERALPILLKRQLPS
ncbi:MAG: ATP-dependent helicase C-terminal domain-containing protein [Bacteriovorax sp.]|nr:ATP-dependent helicase C-terminal domain-containing protein [Bacteriovorax sp.]